MGSANDSDLGEEPGLNLIWTNSGWHDRGSASSGDILLLSFVVLSLVTAFVYVAYNISNKFEIFLNATLAVLTRLFRAISEIMLWRVAAVLLGVVSLSVLVIHFRYEMSVRNWLLYKYHSQIYPLYRMPIRFSFVSFVIAIILSTLGARILYPNVATQTIPLLYASIIVWKEVFFSGIPVIEITDRQPIKDQEPGYHQQLTVANVGSADVTNLKLSYRLFNQGENHFGVIEHPHNDTEPLVAGDQVKFPVEILDDSFQDDISGNYDIVVHATDGYGYALLGGTTCWNDSIGR